MGEEIRGKAWQNSSGFWCVRCKLEAVAQVPSSAKPSLPGVSRKLAAPFSELTNLAEQNIRASNRFLQSQNVFTGNFALVLSECRKLAPRPETGQGFVLVLKGRNYFWQVQHLEGLQHSASRTQESHCATPLSQGRARRSDDTEAGTVDLA